MTVDRWAYLSDGVQTAIGLTAKRGGDALTALDGWYGGAEFRSDNRANRLGDGTFPATTRRGGRKLTLAGVVQRDTAEEIERFERALSGMFPSGDVKGWLEAENSTGVLLCENVEPDGEPRVEANLDYGWCRFELPLYSSDPYLYGPTQQTTAWTGGIDEGLIFPLFDDEDGNREPAPNLYQGAGQATLTNPDGSGFHLDPNNTYDGPLNLTPGVEYEITVTVTTAGYDVSIATVPWTTLAYQVIDGTATLTTRVVWDEDHFNAVIWLDGPGEISDIRITEVGNAGVLEFGNNTHTNPGTLFNVGNATAYPKVTVEGSFPSGADLRLISNGKVFGATYNGPITYAAPLIVDMRGSATVNGIDQSRFLSRRDWGGVDPYGGAVTLELDSSGGAGSARLELRSTYL